MIIDYKDITSEAPIEQVWKLLRNFLDSVYVTDKIRTINNLLNKSQDENITKQADQIGYCIQQAQEYFFASSKVGLPTRPLLLYYGVVSLSTALVLLKQDESHSLDLLRASHKHQHHGLKPIRLAEGANIADNIEAFLSSVKCACHTRKNNPWGLFGLFYQSLDPCSFAFEVEIHNAGIPTFLTTHHHLPCAEKLELNSIIRRSFNMLDLVNSLPDMYFIMRDLGSQPHLCRGNQRRNILRHYKKDKDGKDQLEKEVTTTNFFIDGIEPTDKNNLISYYNKNNPDIKVVDDLGRNLYLQHTIEISSSDEKREIYLPDGVDDISGRLYYILRPQSYLPEPATHQILSFCLGMLSRYYPDVWMHAIGKNVRLAELIDSLLNIIHRKFPNMILNQMTSVKHYIHI